MTSQTFTSSMHDQMLESNRDDVKLEAMRCVTVMTAKGKLSVPRTLFPHIVKNVSSKNPELKKLIYLYLTNFADQEPDLALLPVATLQKSLKSPNPLVRSSALKVLTSMRLNILSAILMATLRNSVNDLSPYVRKTVAHSVIKIYRLDPSLRDDLIEYIERLLNDKNSMVLSSAIASFEIVCPEKLDLIQKHYRRFCFILADCNEWGQTMMLQLLMRYILKTYNKTTRERSDYNPQDHDPKTLLRSAKPLSHSNNSAVVMAVIKLYIAIANHNEVRSTITKPLLRLLHSHREIQLIVLKMVEDLTTLKDETTNIEQSESIDVREQVKLVECSVSEQQLKGYETPSTKESIVGEIKNLISSTSGYQNIDKKDDEQVTKDGYIPLDSDTVTRSESPIETKLGSEFEMINNSDDSTHNENGDSKEKKEVIEEEMDKDGSSEDGEDEDSCDDEDDEDEEEEESSEEEDDDDDDDDDDEDEDDEENNVDVDPVMPMRDANLVSKDNEDFELYLSDMSANKDPSAYREVFRPYIKSFFVKHDDCTQIRLAKLRILTNLSSSMNVSLVLRELQVYIATYVDDKELVTAAIQAIGRCAILVKEVAPTCLNGLTSLLSNNNEHIVSEAIVVLRSQIMNKKTSGLGDSSKNVDSAQSDDGKSEHDDRDDAASSCGDDKVVSTVIKQVTKLLPTVTAPQARATILWILAEFCDKNLTAAKCAPEVLRSMAKSFCQEDNFVKLQSLTLVSKFLLSLDKEKKFELYQKIQLLAGYFFSLAKYDINHDVRDRGRFLKKLLEDERICNLVLNGLEKNEDNHHHQQQQTVQSAA